ncbi:MAG: hypothetical protein ACM3VX_08180, partial [Bacteroidota bacterium]
PGRLGQSGQPGQVGTASASKQARAGQQLETPTPVRRPRRLRSLWGSLARWWVAADLSLRLLALLLAILLWLLAHGVPQDGLF